MKTKYTILILLLVTAAGCNKSNNNTMSDTEMQALLVDKKWQISAEFLRDSTGKISVDAWPSEASYLKDNYFVWKSNMVYYENDSALWTPGNTKPDNDTASWLLNNSVINMAGRPGVSYAPSKIISITATNMTLEFPVSAGTGIYKFITIP